ncbi:MAG: rhodanese-like domain-containing protein [Campylobacterota bacterium]|nr:rhodanese-like domain-containing protein [Campylobacterota bacterium]
MRKLLLSLLATTFVVSSLFGAPAPKSPKKQTSWGLYVDAKEAYAMKKANPKNVLFLDVRDPVEAMFVGFTNEVDYNIPFKTVNPNAWHPKKPVFKLVTNKNFEKDVAKALKLKGMSKDASIIIMCRSGGTRGAPATKLLENKGYKNVYVVTDGFEGSKTKKGDKAGFRLENGWKNSGQPWGYKLDKSKMYFTNFK